MVPDHPSWISRLFWTLLIWLTLTHPPDTPTCNAHWHTSWHPCHTYKIVPDHPPSFEAYFEHLQQGCRMSAASLYHNCSRSAALFNIVNVETSDLVLCIYRWLSSSSAEGQQHVCRISAAVMQQFCSTNLKTMNQYLWSQLCSDPVLVE